MNVLDLFSGIGGFSLGLERAGMKTVAFCEIEKYPQAVLRKHWPEVPIYEDVRTLTAERLRADGIDTIDLICGGFPCQPFSAAGKQRGKEDHRHLWPEMYRIIQECRPTWVIGENVAGFVEMALCDVSADLESAGYEVQPFIIPACAVDAPHRRDRVWIVAHSKSSAERPVLCQGEPGGERRGRSGDGSSTDVAHAKSWQFRDERENIGEKCGEVNPFDHTSRPFSGYDRHQREAVSDCDRKPGPQCDICQERRQHTPFRNDASRHSFCRRWPVEPGVGRVAHGVPDRVDRLKGLGNAVVPQIPEIIGRAIMEVEGR